MDAVVIDVLGIKQSDQGVDVEQRAHDLDIILQKLADKLRCDHHAGSRQQRKSVARARGVRRRPGQSRPHQLRDDLPRNDIATGSDLLHRVEHVIVGIEGRAMASDALPQGQVCPW
jgi:hypothetical protein